MGGHGPWCRAGAWDKLAGPDELTLVGSDWEPTTEAPTGGPPTVGGAAGAAARLAGRGVFSGSAALNVHRRSVLR